MKTRTLRRRAADLAGLSLLFVASSAFAADPIARGKPGASTGNPCSDAPSTAVTEVPPIARGMAAVFCTPYGHVLAAPKGQIWMFLGGVPGFVSANTVEWPRGEPQPKVGHARHFTEIRARRLDAKESKPLLHRAIAGVHGDAIEGGIALEARNDLGVSLRVYMFRTTNGQNWGHMCDPECSTPPFALLHIPVDVGG